MLKYHLKLEAKQTQVSDKETFENALNIKHNNN
jgi:hypothetical protein